MKKPGIFRRLFATDYELYLEACLRTNPDVTTWVKIFAMCKIKETDSWDQIEEKMKGQMC